MENLDPHIGKAFVADGVATTLAGGVGAPGMTTYGENIGVMAVTRVYSTIIFVVAGVFAIFLGLVTKIWGNDPYHSYRHFNGRFDCGIWFDYHCCARKSGLKTKSIFLKTKTRWWLPVTIILGTG